MIVHTDGNDNKNGDDGVVECTMGELLTVADTGRPWMGTLSNEIGQIKIYTSRNIGEDITNYNQEENQKESENEIEEETEKENQPLV